MSSFQILNVESSLTNQGDQVVNGNLTVTGTTTIGQINVTNLTVDKPFLALNTTYTTPAAVTGGVAVNYLPTATTANVATGGFTSTSTVATSGGTFAAGDLILVTGASNKSNNGLFEVQSFGAGTVTIDTTPQEGFSGQAFAVDATAAGKVTKVTVAALRVNTVGDWQTGSGSTVPLTYLSFFNAGGLSGGQVITGGTQASNNLTLKSTSNATKGEVIVEEALRLRPQGTVDLGASANPWSSVWTSTVGPATGSLVLRSANTTALTLDASQNATFQGTVSAATLTNGSAMTVGPTVGNLVLRSANTTALTLDTSQNATFQGSVSAATLTNGSAMTVGPTVGNLVLRSQNATALTLDTSQNAIFQGSVSSATLTNGAAMTVGPTTGNLVLRTATNPSVTLDGTSGNATLHAGAKTATLENVAAGALTVGTTDAQNLLWKTNNATRATINPVGQLSVTKAITTSNNSATEFHSTSGFDLMNSAWTTAATRVGGLVVNYEPIASAVVNAPGFSGSDTLGTSLAEFNAGDFVLVVGANEPQNNGIYQVETHSGNVLTIETSPQEAFCKTAFVADSTAVGTVTNVKLGILRVNTSGTWQHAAASNISGVAYSNFFVSTGIAGGQTITGGTAASENLTLQSTSNATKGEVIVNGAARLRPQGTVDLGSSANPWNAVYTGSLTNNNTITVGPTGSNVLALASNGLVRMTVQADGNIVCESGKTLTAGTLSSGTLAHTGSITLGTAARAMVGSANLFKNVESGTTGYGGTRVNGVIAASSTTSASGNIDNFSANATWSGTTLTNLVLTSTPDSGFNVNDTVTFNAAALDNVVGASGATKDLVIRLRPDDFVTRNLQIAPGTKRLYGEVGQMICYAAPDNLETFCLGNCIRPIDQHIRFNNAYVSGKSLQLVMPAASNNPSVFQILGGFGAGPSDELSNCFMEVQGLGGQVSVNTGSLRTTQHNVMADKQLMCGHGYVVTGTNAPLTGGTNMGLVFVYAPSNSPANISSYTNGNQINTTAPHGFSVGHIVQVKDPLNANNDGVYRVSVVDDVDTVTLDTTSNNFWRAAATSGSFALDGAATGATVNNVAVSVMDVDSTGQFRLRVGNNTNTFNQSFNPRFGTTNLTSTAVLTVNSGPYFYVDAGVSITITLPNANTLTSGHTLYFVDSGFGATINADANFSNDTTTYALGASAIVKLTYMDTGSSRKWWISTSF
jgi:hypothetical protein